MKNYNLTHLDQLEAEAIFVLRETAAQFERPGLFLWRKRFHCDGSFSLQSILSCKIAISLGPCGYGS